MEAARRCGLVLLGLWFCVSVAAQEREPTDSETVAPEVQFRREVVKRYTELNALSVWRAADANARADVRFPDTFDRPARDATVREWILLGRQRIPIALKFITRTDLCCMVDARDRETIEKARGLVEGQEITVEGTIFGIMGARKCVLVDRLLTGGEERSVIDHELIVRWPGRRIDARSIIKSGEYAVEFPSRYEEGAAERLVLIVEEQERDEFLAQLAREAAERDEDAEGGRRRPARKKTYSRFKADAVYEHARAYRPFDVHFDDRFKEFTPGTADLRVVRLAEGTVVPVGHVFDTYSGISCIVPLRDRNLMSLAERIVPGQQLAIKGTVLGPWAGLRAIVVDEIVLPGVTGVRDVPPNVWIVTVYWREQKPRRLYEVGTYRLALPSSYDEQGQRQERVELELREVRLIPHPVSKAPSGERE